MNGEWNIENRTTVYTYCFDITTVVKTHSSPRIQHAILYIIKISDRFTMNHLVSYSTISEHSFGRFQWNTFLCNIITIPYRSIPTHSRKWYRRHYFLYAILNFRDAGWIFRIHRNLYSIFYVIYFHQFELIVLTSETVVKIWVLSH